MTLELPLQHVFLLCVSWWRVHSSELTKCCQEIREILKVTCQCCGGEGRPHRLGRPVIFTYHLPLFHLSSSLESVKPTAATQNEKVERQVLSAQTHLVRL